MLKVAIKIYPKLPKLSEVFDLKSFIHFSVTVSVSVLTLLGLTDPPSAKLVMHEKSTFWYEITLNPEPSICHKSDRLLQINTRAIYTSCTFWNQYKSAIDLQENKILPLTCEKCRKFTQLLWDSQDFLVVFPSIKVQLLMQVDAIFLQSSLQLWYKWFFRRDSNRQTSRDWVWVSRKH